jgi:hypothetical protein
MDSFANLSARERSEVLEEAASQQGLHPAIMEKDFWVCWILMKLFDDGVLSKHLVFKGGTSLSKAHHLIERFSEDIDLVLDWGLLGYGEKGLDPWQSKPSNNQLDRFNKEFNEQADHYIKQELVPQIASAVASCPLVLIGASKTEPQVVEVQYPAAFKLNAIRPQVKLEIGPLASWVPSANYSIRPYVADLFPKLFTRSVCNVTAITAERTFWEKATILHQQSHRTTTMPSGYSRHYYDMVMLASSSVKSNALGNLKLLRDVVEFKQRFYRSGWARYDLATPGTFRLLPNDVGEKPLRDDYRAMRPMFFSEPPSWNAILESLMKLENEINSL